jgi:hypothetical protein
MSEILVQCSRCVLVEPLSFWAVKKNGEPFKMCLRCREKRREYLVTYPIGYLESQLLIANERYRTDELYRNTKRANASALSKTPVVCSGCGKGYTYGSLLPHSKTCKGPKKKTTLDLLLEFSAD